MTRRLVSLVAAAAFAITLLASAGAGRAYACDCAPADPEGLFASADLVFVGTVAEIAIAPGLPGNEGMEPMSVTFAVEDVLKGAVDGGMVAVSTAGNSAACGVSFASGQRWQVNATLDRAAGYFTHLCSGDVLLGQGEVPATTEAGGGGPPAPVLLVGGVLAILVGVSAYAFTRGSRGERAA